MAVTYLIPRLEQMLDDGYLIELLGQALETRDIYETQLENAEGLISWFESNRFLTVRQRQFVQSLLSREGSSYVYLLPPCSLQLC